VVNEEDTFEARVRALGEKLAARKPPPTPQPPPTAHYEQLPDLGGPNLTDADREMDALIKSIDFPTAYNKWIGKMHAVQKKDDGNFISCPNPSHADPPKGNGASGYNAWFKSDGTWTCGKCDDGGDIFDIAAIHFGYPRPEYKQGEMFHKLREDMAADFGFRTKKVAGGKIGWIEPQETPKLTVVPDVQEVQSPSENVTDEPDQVQNVSPMWADDGEPELVIYPTIDWRNLIPEDTFLYEYMKACTNDDAPEEYHFWHGLMALGLVCGRNVTLDDTQPVYGNILLCILGATGTGKSRSRRHLNTVLREAAPYHEDGTRTTGCKIIPVPSSGEYLVHQFTYEGKDPGNGKTSLGFQRVVGVVDFDEMSALLSRANRQGSTLKPTLMSLADATHEVKIGGLQRGDFIAHEPFCSITASTQPKAIRTLLNRNDTGSGFLNRWIFAGGKQKRIEALGGDRSNISVNLESAIEELRKVRGWAGFERKVGMDDDAYELYEKFFYSTIAPAKEKDETDLIKRIDLIIKKLMLLLTMNLRKTSVPLQVVETAITLYDYVLECYGILNSNIGVTLMQDVMREIQRHIIRHQKQTSRGASARDIARYTARRNYSLEQIKKALEVMTALDIIELEPKQSKMGRPTARYLVVGES
jgi:energy-coupling factor transporter ATP-binding protein EcfA2